MRDFLKTEKKDKSVCLQYKKYFFLFTINYYEYLNYKLNYTVYKCKKLLKLMFYALILSIYLFSHRYIDYKGYSYGDVII